MPNPYVRVDLQTRLERFLRELVVLPTQHKTRIKLPPKLCDVEKQDSPGVPPVTPRTPAIKRQATDSELECCLIGPRTTQARRRSPEVAQAEDAGPLPDSRRAALRVLRALHWHLHQLALIAVCHGNNRVASFESSSAYSGFPCLSDVTVCKMYKDAQRADFKRVECAPYVATAA